MNKKDEIILNENIENDTYYVVGIVVTIVTLAIVVGITAGIVWALISVVIVILGFGFYRYFHKSIMERKIMKNDYSLGIVMKVDKERRVVYIYECNKRDALNKEYTIQYRTSCEKIKDIEEDILQKFFKRSCKER